MKLIKTISQMQKEVRRLRRAGKSVGFVPTMGALHEGHLSLVRASNQENDVTVVSIFVNPLQFGPKEDLKKYPRPLKKDLALLKKEKVDFVFLPSAEEMYPKKQKTGDRRQGTEDGRRKTEDRGQGIGSQKHKLSAELKRMMKPLCGKFRPGHFQGVITVVARLFEIVDPNQAYFGAKDYQQAKIIKKMNQEFGFGIKIQILPTVREEDGLAMSSRNQYLNPEERQRARAISQILLGIEAALIAKRIKIPQVLKWAHRELSRFVDKIQYLEIVDPKTLKSISKLQAKMLIAAACYVGKTRLIDNVIITPSKL